LYLVVHYPLQHKKDSYKPGPPPGRSSRGGQKPEGGPHFKNTVLDVGSNRWAKSEIGGHRFQMGGRAPLPPPAGDDPAISRFAINVSIGVNSAKKNKLKAKG